jgi:hypothetical protein
MGGEYGGEGEQKEEGSERGSREKEAGGRKQEAGNCSTVEISPAGAAPASCFLLSAAYY